MSSSAQTARKEAKEGTTYQTGVGLNLDVNTNSNSTKPKTNLGQAKFQAISSEQFKEIENILPPYTPRPEAEGVQFDENNTYNFLVFDTETNTTGKLAEIYANYQYVTCLIRTDFQNTYYQYMTSIFLLQE